MLEFWSLDDSSSKRIMHVLETVYLIFQQNDDEITRVATLRVVAGESHD